MVAQVYDIELGYRVVSLWLIDDYNKLDAYEGNTKALMDIRHNTVAKTDCRNEESVAQETGD